MSDLVDVTPEGSAAPVFLDTSEQVPVGDVPLAAEVLDAQAALLESGIAKLVALDLTEEEARAIARG